MLHILKAPEFVGRPEAIINASVIKSVAEAGLEYLSYDSTVPTSEVDVVGACYDDDAFTRGSSIQAMNFLHNFKDGDDVLCLEGFNPALLWLRMSGKKLGKVGTLYHSSTSIDVDMYADDLSMVRLEQAVSEMADFVFCATEYLAEKVKETTPNAKTRVVGLPFDVNGERFLQARGRKKQNRVVFNHRWAEDKRPEMFLELASKMPSYEFVILTPYSKVSQEIYSTTKRSSNVEIIVCKQKTEYFEELAKSRFIFSAAELETFGYSVIEGVASGCIPVLTNTACYPELYEQKYLGETVLDLKKIIESSDTFDIGMLVRLEEYNYASEHMIDHF